MNIIPHSLLIAMLLLLMPAAAYAQISIEQDVVIDSQLNINLNDFVFSSSSDMFSIEIIPGTMKWRRNSELHLNPFVKILIKNKSKFPEQKLKYDSQIFNPTMNEDHYLYTLDYNLFDLVPLEVYAPDNKSEKKIAEFKLNIKPQRSSIGNGNTILYDHTCAPFYLKITHLTTESNYFLTTRCQIESYGESGKEVSLLSLSLQSPDLHFSNNTKTLRVQLKNNETADVSAVSLDGRTLNLKLQAQVPHRFHRMKTALGFGPYIYQVKDQSITIPQQTIEEKTTASYMFYGRYDLTALSSIKFFDALIATETLFNNFGVYFSYDLASALDQRFVINALLGTQGIHFRFPGDSAVDFTMIAPQGFEMIYKHPFGMTNYNLTYGGFFSTQSDKPYINTWIRFGKGMFWEVNYINWENNKKAISMLGLSIGIPFKQFF